MCKERNALNHRASLTNTNHLTLRKFVTKRKREKEKMKEGWFIFHILVTRNKIESLRSSSLFSTTMSSSLFKLSPTSHIFYLSQRLVPTGFTEKMQKEKRRKRKEERKKFVTRIESSLTGLASARVVLVQIMAEGVPAATHSHHNVASKNSHEDQHLRVSDTVFPFGNADHGELRWTRAPFHQVSNLKHENRKISVKKMSKKNIFRRRVSWKFAKVERIRRNIKMYTSFDTCLIRNVYYLNCHKEYFFKRILFLLENYKFFGWNGFQFPVIIQLRTSMVLWENPSWRQDILMESRTIVLKDLEILG